MPQSTPRPWTQQEDEYIRAHYLTLSGQGMADALSRPLYALYQRKHQLGCVVVGKRREARQCKQCGQPFEVIHASPRKFCTVSCAYANKERIVERPKDRGMRVCPQCGDEYRVTTAKALNTYCSGRCRSDARKKFEDRICVQCGTTFTIGTKSLRRCCTPTCTTARKAANSRALWASEEMRQALSDRTSLRHALTPMDSPQYSNRKSGHREDLGIFVRSAWEANYARYLNWLISQRQIKSWRYEPVTFWFEKIKRGVRSYKPDFEITNLDDSIEYHEVKGYDHPRGITARKRMAIYHPHVKLVLIDEAQYKEIRKWKRLMPDWEGR